MKVSVIVGGKGTGKTTFLKSVLNKVHPKARLVYDVNNEYRELYPHSLLDHDVFLEKVINVQNAVVIFEEATIFFSNRGDDRSLKNLLVRARHTNNMTFLVYHSLRAVPVYILDLANFIVLFKTNDSFNRIEKKFQNDELNTMFKNVNKHTSIHYNETLELM